MIDKGDTHLKSKRCACHQFAELSGAHHLLSAYLERNQNVSK
jgi:hypothetical protein